MARRRGFSLIEALIVLAVAGAALMLIFSVGVRSTEIAFRLGRRALDVADRQLSTDALRVVIQGLALSPTGPQTRKDGFEVVGAPRQFSGPVVLPAATPCAGSGPLGRVVVTLASDPTGDVVTCQADGGQVIPLADLRPRRARFSYSDDGLNWNDSWRDTPDPIARSQAPRERAVYVRLATDDGRIEVIERATSGRPDLHPVSSPTSAPGTPAL